MKSKKLTLALSIFTGSTGSNRFYLGQNTAGWIVLLTFWVLLPGLGLYIIKFNVVPNWEPFLLARFALPIIYQLVETGRYMTMSDAKFMSQDRSKGKTFVLTLLSIFITGALIITSNKFIAEARTIDITKVEVSAVLSAEKLSQDFRSNEVEFRKTYDNKPLQIEGTVVETGNDFEQGPYLALKGFEKDAFGIKCFFIEEHAGETGFIKLQDKIVIKGVCDGNKLENCTIISVNGKDIPLTH